MSILESSLLGLSTIQTIILVRLLTRSGPPAPHPTTEPAAPEPPPPRVVGVASELVVAAHRHQSASWTALNGPTQVNPVVAKARRNRRRRKGSAVAVPGLDAEVIELGKRITHKITRQPGDDAS